MRKIENPQEFRNNVIIKLKDMLKNDKLASNLEKGIFNYSLKHAEKINVVKKWDNSYFVKIYVNRLRTIRSNLKDEKLIESIINKKIKAHEVAFMTHQEMQPDNWSELLELKKIRDENKYEPKLEASTDDFKCWKCKSKKCTYYQLQTRSADEPMTTFVSCLDCGNRWKC
jgi:transcription elongation factor S-II|uniref:TFIIS-type domain-containing protein n=1 Tax=viral metagenome TaxID=1070528 RepID=A0A6C0CWJ5_9ZZZZ